MTIRYNAIAHAVAGHGLALRGGFDVTPADGVPATASGLPAVSVLMVGNTGRAMWDAFQAARVDGAHPLDRWTRGVTDPIARQYGARAIYPYDAPPMPFQRWAARAWPLHASPLGLLIDAQFGLWHALRVALVFPDKVEWPQTPPTVSPCQSCRDKPCLSMCPVDAFSAAGFDYRGCRDYLATPAADDCLAHGCRARVACPVGAAHRYSDAQLQFHQRSFSGITRTPG